MEQYNDAIKSISNEESSISINNSSYDELLSVFDIYINKYKDLTLDPLNDVNKLDLIEKAVTIHNLLLMESNIKNHQDSIYNFIQFGEYLTVYLDDQITRTNDLDLIMNAIDYIFKNEYIVNLLDIHYELSDDHNQRLFHNSLTMILLNKLTLYEKYIDDVISKTLDDSDIIESIFIKLKIDPIKETLSYIYNNLNDIAENDNQYKDIKLNLMELLCLFDMEEIYS